MTHAFSRLRAAVAAALLLFAPVAGLAQESKSAALAAELATLMAQAKADSIAAAYPGSTDQFVGALFNVKTVAPTVAGANSATYDVTSAP